ncbi:cytochrome P450 [Aureobasidium pullulans EXF-150]|uniref:Cytochrome P450 n=1 Tax=Aureobasidium pullulans EXF-150 TaxID=1043002 RepID=A0A074X4X2_AURPU|nr:cytochrome P450 [Aureobasidium pullulans EXF-150]KEQ78829.1 cytochrome P450 [Aureobasidium pullulans EXF-150]
MPDFISLSLYFQSVWAMVALVIFALALLACHEYPEKICRKTGYPICTISLLTGKAYVVGCPSTIQASFRNRDISFAPFAIEFVDRMDVLSQAAKKAYAEGLHETVIKTFHSTMNGASLRKMNVVALQEVARLLPGGATEPADPQTGCQTTSVQVEDVWVWLRDIMTISTTTALFGKKNSPWLKHPSLVKTYCSTDMIGTGATKQEMFLGEPHSQILPTDRHDIPSPSLPGTVANEDQGEVGPTTTKLAEIQRQVGYTATELGATYTVVLHGALVNMVPTMFWFAMYVFTQRNLLEQLRIEVAVAVSMDRATGKNCQRNAFVNSGNIDKTCPLLLSTLRETQRLVSLGTLHRRALKDTVIPGLDENGNERSYLLKKGTAMLLSIKWNHRDPLIWGASVNDFVADRFFDGENKRQDPVGVEERVAHDDDHTGTDARNLRRKAYMPFGGGKELCPGPNFATSEMLGTMVILILGYDIRRKDGGVLDLPKFAPPKMTQTTARPHPGADLQATVSRREGWEDILWSVRTHTDPETATRRT